MLPRRVLLKRKRHIGSRKEVHEPKVHNVWGTEFGAHNQWSTEPMEHRVIRCTGFWSTTFGAQNQWSTGLFGAPDKWGTGLAKYLGFGFTLFP